MIPKFTVEISLQKKRLLLFIKMRFHPQKQQIKNRRWKNKIGFLLFSFECFARATVVRKNKEKYLSSGGKSEKLGWDYISCLCSSLSGVVSICDTSADHKGGICSNTRKVSMFSPFLMLIHTNNVAAEAVNGTILTPTSSKDAWGQTIEDSWDTWERWRWVQAQSPAALHSEWVAAFWGITADYKIKTKLRFMSPGVFGAAQE